MTQDPKTKTPLTRQFGIGIAPDDAFELIQNWVKFSEQLETALCSVALALGVPEADVDACKTAEELAGKCKEAIRLQTAIGKSFQEASTDLAGQRDQLRSALRETAMALDEAVQNLVNVADEMDSPPHHSRSDSRFWREESKRLDLPRNNPAVRAVMEEKE